MTTVFVSGSRSLGRLNDDVRARLDNMIEKGHRIIVGDANGADKAMQTYLAGKGYSNVTIFHVGKSPRNNIGMWPTQNVEAGEQRSGRDFYAQKDKKMAVLADFGFVLWDGKSAGSVQNMLWLADRGKKLVVYLAPQHDFHSFSGEGDLLDFLAGCDEATIDEIGRKIALPESLKAGSKRQPSLGL